MKNLFLCTLYLTCLLTYSAKACDADGCQIATSVAIGIGCAAAGAALTLPACIATFGGGCAIGAVATAGICGGLTPGAEYGKTHYI